MFNNTHTILFLATKNNNNQVVFEEFQFGQYLRRPPSWFAAYEFRSTCTGIEFPDSCLVLDSGFSFSYITPFVEGHALPYAVREQNKKCICVNHLCRAWILIFCYSTIVQTSECGGEVINKLFKRNHEFSPVEYDGRI
jgi:hypothetical protein